MTTKGQIVQVQGAVVDCEFPPGELPEIYHAIEVPTKTETHPHHYPTSLIEKPHLPNFPWAS